MVCRMRTLVQVYCTRSTYPTQETCTRYALDHVNRTTPPRQTWTSVPCTVDHTDRTTYLPWPERSRSWSRWSVVCPMGPLCQPIASIALADDQGFSPPRIPPPWKCRAATIMRTSPLSEGWHVSKLRRREPVKPLSPEGVLCGSNARNVAHMARIVDFNLIFLIFQRRILLIRMILGHVPAGRRTICTI